MGNEHLPPNGASTFHKGLDIGAPEGFEFVAVTDGIITFTDFLGGGGFTITLTDKNQSNGDVKYSYCHCNPDFIVHVGQEVAKGQIIGKVGPKYVNRRFSEINILIVFGNPTNSATTGHHLHFGMRINGEYVNPLDYITP